MPSRAVRNLPCTRAVAGVFAGALLATSACGELAQEPQLLPASAPLALALALPAPGSPNAVFGANLDRVRVFVGRSDESTALDTTISWAADDEGLRLAFQIGLRQRVETLYVSVDLLAGQAVHFYANTSVVLRAETVPTIPSLPLTYIGPGWDAVSLSVGPRASALLPNATLQLSTSALNSFGQVVSPPIAWKVSDTRLATISAGGLLMTKSLLGSVWVKATTPTGLADSLQVLIATQLP